jgi:hypothetical protein
LPQQRGNLVAQRLAAAGRHQHQRVTTFAQVLDDGLLLAAETGITENALQQVERCGMHDAHASKTADRTYWQPAVSILHLQTMAVSAGQQTCPASSAIRT